MLLLFFRFSSFFWCCQGCEIICLAAHAGVADSTIFMPRARIFMRGAGGVVSAMGRRGVIYGVLMLQRVLAWCLALPPVPRQGEGSRLHHPILPIHHLSYTQSLVLIIYNIS